MTKKELEEVKKGIDILKSKPIYITKFNYTEGLMLLSALYWTESKELYRTFWKLFVDWHGLKIMQEAQTFIGKQEEHFKQNK